MTGLAVAALGLALSGGAAGQGAGGVAIVPAPQNVISLQAQASTEVPQDLLTMVLAVTREGPDAAQVQSQLRQVLDGALADARRAAQPGQIEVRTGGFSLYPRTNNKPGSGNSIVGWIGRAELVLEGKDTGGLSQLAGRLTGLTVQQVSFGLSREARDRVEAEVAAQAISRFKARAERYAQLFGFAGYAFREVNVGGTEVAMSAVVPAVRMARAMVAAAPADEAQPLEAGKATVSVTVSGSIQLSPR